jgi:DNA-directed RNA polymerase specialized sigma subunit
MIEKSKYDEYHMTQQEVADALGIKRSYVGCIETRAKAKLKIELEKRGLKLDDLIGGMA